LNEDAFRVGTEMVCGGREGAVRGRALYGRPFVAAVADGMGGHEHGEVASAMVVRCLDHRAWTSERSPASRIQQELESAHLSWSAMGSGQGRSPGSTVVGIYHDGEDFFSFHAGDSRLYRLHEGRLMQLTTDHTMQARYGGVYNRNVLYNCVGGGSEDFTVVMNNLPPMESPADLLILVSDGLYDGLTDTMLLDALHSGSSAEDLLALAIKAGSQDNVTVMLLRIVDTDGNPGQP
jgi:protein phosphatase